jgi:YVTN family beta-propeller protein
MEVCSRGKSWKWLVAFGVFLVSCGRNSDGSRGPAVADAAYRTTTGAVNIYAEDGANNLAPAAARALPMVYVPNSRSGSVTVIDPKTYQVVRTFPTGKVPQHVVPSYDLSTLWVANNSSNSLTPIDPVTAVRTTCISLPTGRTRWSSPKPATGSISEIRKT